MYEDSEYLRRVIKKRRTGGIVMSVCCALLAGFFIVMGLMISKSDKDALPVLLLFGGVAVIPLIFGIIKIISPLALIGKYARANLEKFAPDMDRKIVYEDKFIIVSEQAIAFPGKPHIIVGRNDVIAAWVYTSSYNLIPTSKTLNLYTPEAVTVQINVYGRKKETIKDIFIKIAQYCPNCRMGYSLENQKFVSYSQKQFRQDHKNK